MKKRIFSKLGDPAEIRIRVTGVRARSYNLTGWYYLSAERVLRKLVIFSKVSCGPFAEL
ncbi:MAG: hypothetical protein PVI90_16950 [Desulfobacteraceae bacterium]|jgi:hypothetical protein